ncbi:hypothetical protein GCM10023196_097710 [Actinoallomurus vinaceus]|uniref:Uncharacterized protein n=1 Tax=Actinoallomurus vinaceus TaxID=1080074 RepID=A0ABP8UU30_9ACTN
MGGPEGGLDRLVEFSARYGGLSFCQERPECDGQHKYQYNFSIYTSSWEPTDSDDWVAVVGDTEGCQLTFDWSTGRIGVDVVGPETWIADSVVNLIESAALAQYIYGSIAPHRMARRVDRWQEAVPVEGKGPGWGLANVSSERFRGLVPEVTQASSPWNRWFADEQVAVHAWLTTYEIDREEVVMAWYRGAQGRQRIESVTGPLR